MRTHLEVRRTLGTFRMREDLAVVSPINDEINGLRVRLEKLEGQEYQGRTVDINFTV